MGLEAWSDVVTSQVGLEDQSLPMDVRLVPPAQERVCGVCGNLGIHLGGSEAGIHLVWVLWNNFMT